jgi:hypothetical protein
MFTIVVCRLSSFPIEHIGYKQSGGITYGVSEKKIGWEVYHQNPCCWFYYPAGE